MADKVLSFSIKAEVSEEALKLAALERELKKLTTAKTELLKVMQKESGNTKENQVALANLTAEIKKTKTEHDNLKKVVDTASESYARMSARYAELKKITKEGSGATKEQTAEMKKLYDQMSKIDQSTGNFSRNVGNYSDAFKDVGKNILSMAGPAAIVAAGLKVATYVFEGFKEAIMSTTTAINNLNIYTAMAKQLFYDLTQSGEANSKSMQKVAIATKELNRLRVEEYKDQYEISILERELQKQRLIASNQALDLTEKLTALNEVKRLEKAEVKIEIEHLKAQLTAAMDLLSVAPKNEKRLATVYELMTKINNTYAESDRSMKRIETTRTGYIKKEEEDRKKLHDDLQKWADDEIKAEEEKDKKIASERKKAAKDEEKDISDNHKIIRDLYKKKWQDIVNEEKAGNSLMSEVWKLRGLKEKDLGLQLNKEIQDNNIKGSKAAADYDFKLTKEGEDKKTAYKEAALEGAQMGLDASFNSKRNRLQAEMEAELTNVNLTEQQKVNIRKKYGKEQQRMDITQAIINGALAVGKAAMNLWPIPALPMMALAALTTGIQVATIKSQQYAKGGKITTGTPVYTGTKDDTMIIANKTETVLTQDHVQKLGGSAMMRHIKVPGYELGGYLGQRAPEIPSPGFDYAAIAKMINGIQVTLELNKLNKAQKELNIITETQRI